MKKFLLIAVLCISSISAYASGLRSVDMRANLRSDFGLGVGLTFDLPKGFRGRSIVKLLLQWRQHVDD